MKTALYLCLFAFASLVHSQSVVDPDASRTLDQLVDSRPGFKLLHYQVTTTDGYILEVDRLVTADYTADTARQYSAARKPVVGFHGILFASNAFFYNSAELNVPTDNNDTIGDTFAFGLVQTGRYDFWAPNSRGNGVSNGHVKFNSKFDPRYWDFSFEEIARFDVPAILELVKRETGYNQVGWVGHSQGATVIPTLLSFSPEYAASIRPFIAWAPSAYIGNMKSKVVLQLLSAVLQFLPGEFRLTDAWLNEVLSRFCRPGTIINGAGVCKALLDEVFGESTSLNQTRLPVYMHFSPNPASNKGMIHFSQLASSGKFRRYDYGLVRNLVEYGSVTPPEYRLTNIPASFTTVVFYGSTDAMVVPVDARQFIKKLADSGVEVYREPITRPWSHFDFVAGEGAGVAVYDRTLAYLDHYASGTQS